MITTQLDYNAEILSVVVRPSSESTWTIKLSDFLPWASSLADLRIENESPTQLFEIAAIFNALEKNETVKLLSFKDLKPAERRDTLPDWAAGLRHTNLESLVLQDLQLHRSVKPLADALLKNNKLSSLTIIDASLKEEDLQTLLNGVLENNSLVQLNLPGHLKKSDTYKVLMDTVATKRGNPNNNSNSPNNSPIRRESVQQLPPPPPPPPQPKIENGVLNYEDLEQLVVTKSEEILALDNENKELKQYTEKLVSFCKNYREENERLKHECEDLKQHISKANEDNNSLVQKNDLWGATVEAVVLENEAMGEKYEDLAHEMALIQKEKETLQVHSESVKTQLQLEIEQLKENNAALKLQLEFANARMNLNSETNSSIVIPFQDITLLTKIGQGSYGKVYFARWHDQNIAVKRIKRSMLDTSKIDDLIHESRTVMQLRHKHIVLSMGTSEDPGTGKLMLVMEYMKHGTLQDLLFGPEKKDLTPSDVIRLALDVAKGLHYLHNLTPKIAHLDLKCGNILLYHNRSRAKISDFGTAKFLNQQLRFTESIKGTLGYLAPELLDRSGYNETADIYSFGIVLLVMATRSNTLPNPMGTTPLDQKIRKHFEISTMSHDEQLKNLILECCSADPSKRPSMGTCITTLKAIRERYSTENVNS